MYLSNDKFSLFWIRSLVNGLTRSKTSMCHSWVPFTVSLFKEDLPYHYTAKKAHIKAKSNCRKLHVLACGLAWWSSSVIQDHASPLSLVQCLKCQTPPPGWPSLPLPLLQTQRSEPATLPPDWNDKPCGPHPTSPPLSVWSGTQRWPPQGELQRWPVTPDFCIIHQFQEMRANIINTLGAYPQSPCGWSSAALYLGRGREGWPFFTPILFPYHVFFMFSPQSLPRILL